MTVKAIVEKVDERQYRARIWQPFSLESTGETEQEAVDKLRALAAQRLRESRIIDLDIPNETAAHPLLRFAGIWRDNPDLDEFRRNVEEHRKEMDALEIP